MTILSSPYARCVETVEPVATARGLDVEPTDLLAEGAGDRVLEIILDPATPAAVLCTHGDVIADVLETLVDRGLALEGEVGCEKGSIWMLDVDGGEVVGARYQSPRPARRRAAIGTVR
jgi:8-oxo-dGTP diphosphatase